MAKLRPMIHARKDGSPIVVDDKSLGFVVVRWRNGAWDTGFASEMDGDQIVADDPVGWIKLPPRG